MEYALLVIMTIGLAYQIYRLKKTVDEIPEDRRVALNNKMPTGIRWVFSIWRRG